MAQEIPNGGIEEVFQEHQNSPGYRAEKLEYELTEEMKRRFHAGDILGATGYALTLLMNGRRLIEEANQE